MPKLNVLETSLLAALDEGPLTEEVLNTMDALVALQPVSYEYYTNIIAKLNKKLGYKKIIRVGSGSELDNIYPVYALKA